MGAFLMTNQLFAVHSDKKCTCGFAQLSAIRRHGCKTGSSSARGTQTLHNNALSRRCVFRVEEYDLLSRYSAIRVAVGYSFSDHISSRINGGSI